jgi:hypothetical protein
VNRFVVVFIGAYGFDDVINYGSPEGYVSFCLTVFYTFFLS